MRPNAPAATAAAMALKVSSKRRWNTTDSVRPRLAAAAITRRASALVIASGFSTSTCLPAAIAASASDAWLPLEVAIETSATSGSANSDAGSVVKRQPSSSATRRARPSSRDETPTRRAPGISRAARAWVWPMPPQPMTATPSVCPTVDALISLLVTGR